MSPAAGETKARFARIAAGYDRANTILSFGIHHHWRRRFVRFTGAGAGMKVLDCATGTGDLALALEKTVGREGRVTGIDFCPQMLEVAREKASRRASSLCFRVADVLALPFPEASFDLTTIAFGIRNVECPRKALRELARVTKPGGTVAILEFGQARLPVWREMFGLFSRHFLPRVGGWLTGDRPAYEYLTASSASFPCGDEFLRIFDEVGAFTDARALCLTGGVAYGYRARRGN